MQWRELIDALDRLIDYESERIRHVFPKVLADATTREYRDNIGLFMRYAGKRDAYVYIKHLLEWGSRSPVYKLSIQAEMRKARMLGVDSIKRRVDGVDWTEDDGL